ncbi:small ribosomal subunit protein mS26-like [Ptychodera flava]|uniref:small ribosomal subunit protein mS26-like n=1 Tax=Ptychodera flava TaxID=63121 RepID=UPI00396A9739
MYSRTNHVLSRVGGLNFAWNPWQETTPTITQFYRGRKGFFGRGIPRPPSQSKLNYVRKPTPRDPWETEFLREKYRIYNTQLKSLSFMFKQELEGKTAGISFEEIERRALEEHNTAMEWNRQENERVRLIREARQGREAELQQRDWKDERLKRFEEAAMLKEEYELMVKAEKEASKSFITLETLDEAIERALADPKDYNFAIDKEGRKIYKSDIPIAS